MSDFSWLQILTYELIYTLAAVEQSTRTILETCDLSDLSSQSDFFGSSGNIVNRGAKSDDNEFFRLIL